MLRQTINYLLLLVISSASLIQGIFWWGSSSSHAAHGDAVATHHNDHGVSEHPDYRWSMFRNLDELLGSPFSGLDFRRLQFLNGVNLKPTQRAYNLFMDVPGIEHQEVNVTVDHDTLILSADHTCDKSKEETCIERHYRTTLLLPPDADQDHLSAGLEHGVVHVYIPRKVSHEKPAPKLLPLQKGMVYMTDIAKHGASSISSVVSQATGGVKHGVGMAGESIASGTEMVKQMGSQATDTVMSAGSRATDILKEGVSGASESMASMGHKATNMASQATSTLVSGAAEGVRKAAERVSEAAQSVSSQAEDYEGPHATGVAGKVAEMFGNIKEKVMGHDGGDPVPHHGHHHMGGGSKEEL